MNQEGPQLEALLHRLSECPVEFLQVSAKQAAERVDSVAIACDHLRSIQGAPPPELAGQNFRKLCIGLPHASLVAVVCWLLNDPWFLDKPQLVPAMWRLLLSDELTQLNILVKAEQFVRDPDRREELVRVCLKALSLRPRGETEFQAADRLATLDSAERRGVLRATAAAERRARQVREAMAKARAQEAASRYGE
jgi:hypothetical protein